MNRVHATEQFLKRSNVALKLRFKDAQAEELVHNAGVGGLVTAFVCRQVAADLREQRVAILLGQARRPAMADLAGPLLQECKAHRWVTALKLR